MGIFSVYGFVSNAAAHVVNSIRIVKLDNRVNDTQDEVEHLLKENEDKNEEIKRMKKQLNNMEELLEGQLRAAREKRSNAERYAEAKKRQRQATDDTFILANFDAEGNRVTK